MRLASQLPCQPDLHQASQCHQPVPAASPTHLPLALSFQPSCCATTEGPPCVLIALSRSPLHTDTEARAEKQGQTGAHTINTRARDLQRLGAWSLAELLRRAAACAVAAAQRSAVPCPQASACKYVCRAAQALVPTCSSPEAHCARAAPAHSRSTAPAPPPAPGSCRPCLRAGGQRKGGRGRPVSRCAGGKAAKQAHRL